jgi:hypothetical protein
MGALVFVDNNPNFNIPRSYLSGFVVWSSFATEPFWDGLVLQWTSTPGYIYRLAMKTNGYNWNSNVYTISRLFDAPNSSIDCVHFACFDQVNFGTSDILNEGKQRIWAKTFAIHTATRLIALPPAPASYWLQQPPY